MTATITEWLVAWPLAFSVGVLVGLGAASRWRIVRQRDQWTAEDVQRLLEERRARD
jgi:hypothetical protein